MVSRLDMAGFPSLEIGYRGHILLYAGVILVMYRLDGHINVYIYI